MATPSKRWTGGGEPAFTEHRPVFVSRVNKPRTMSELIDGIDAPMRTIADKLGVCERTLRAVRTGAYKPRRIARLRICVGLGLSLDQLDALLDAQMETNRVTRRATLR